MIKSEIPRLLPPGSGIVTKSPHKKLYDGIAATDSQYAMNAMIEALGNGWSTPEAAPDQTVNAAVQEAMYDAMFGVMQGTYSPDEAIANMDSAASN